MSKELIERLRTHQHEPGPFTQDAMSAAAEIERLQAQFERLVNLLKVNREELDKAETSIATLQAEVGLLRTDAARYRWLRSLQPRDEAGGSVAVRRTLIVKGTVASSSMLVQEELDVAVDTAMRTTPPADQK